MPKKQSPKKKPTPKKTNPKNNNKKTLIINIIAISTLVLATIGALTYYYIFMNQSTTPNTPTTQSPTTEQPPKNPESKQPAPDKSANTTKNEDETEETDNQDENDQDDDESEEESAPKNKKNQTHHAPAESNDEQESEADATSENNEINVSKDYKNQKEQERLDLENLKQAEQEAIQAIETQINRLNNRIADLEADLLKKENETVEQQNKIRSQIATIREEITNLELQKKHGRDKLLFLRNQYNMIDDDLKALAGKDGLTDIGNKIMIKKFEEQIKTERSRGTKDFQKFIDENNAKLTKLLIEDKGKELKIPQVDLSTMMKEATALQELEKQLDLNNPEHFKALNVAIQELRELQRTTTINKPVFLLGVVITFFNPWAGITVIAMSRQTDPPSQAAIDAKKRQVELLIRQFEDMYNIQHERNDLIEQRLRNEYNKNYEEFKYNKIEYQNYRQNKIDQIQTYAKIKNDAEKSKYEQQLAEDKAVQSIINELKEQEKKYFDEKKANIQKEINLKNEKYQIYRQMQLEINKMAEALNRLKISQEEKELLKKQLQNEYDLSQQTFESNKTLLNTRMNIILNNIAKQNQKLHAIYPHRK